MEEQLGAISPTLPNTLYLKRSHFCYIFEHIKFLFLQTKSPAALSTFPFLTFSAKVKHHKSEARTPDVTSSVLRRYPQEKELLGEYCVPNQLFQQKVQKGITLLNLHRARTSHQENCLQSVALLHKP